MRLRMNSVVQQRTARSLVTWYRILATGFAIASMGCFESDRPSILLVSVDTLRADHLGVYGFDADTSPNLDAFASKSVVFERGLAASSRTAPSHASIMTSLWVREHSVGPINGATRLAKDERTLAARFREAGWETAAFISNFMLDRRLGMNVGFDVYDDELIRSESNRDWVMERYADETTSLALDWLDRDREDPFFLWVHYNDPHGPYQPPPPHDAVVLARHDSDEPALPVLDNQLGLNGIPAYQRIEGLSMPSEYHQRYAGEIQAFDASLAELLSGAERTAAPGGLVVLITADHGESLGERNIYFAHGHGTMPELAHVPFLLRAPGLEPGRRDELVHHVDILPTLLDIAGLPIPETARGIPLARSIQSDSRLPARTLFVDVGSEVSAYRGNQILRAHPGAAVGDVVEGSRDEFRWAVDGALVDDEVAADLHPTLDEYMRLKPPMLRARRVSPERKAHLRALGYLHPEK